jgi:hypothetical protein
MPYGISFRNIVCCGVVEACTSRGAAATLLIPTLTESDAKQIATEVPARVTVRELLPARHSATFTCLKLFKQHLYARRTGTESFRVKHARRRRERPFVHAGATVLERFSELLLSEAWVDARLMRARQPFERHYERLLDELGVDVIVLSKPGYSPEDLALIKAARSRHIPTISIDTTWDNIVSKRPTYLAPDALTAWSDRMRDEAIKFYGLSPQHVPVTGGAPFDVFFVPEQLPSRTMFLQSLGLDPSKKLIVFTLNSPIFNLQNPLFIKFLLESVRIGAIHGDPNVVIRMHPFDRDSDHTEVVRGYGRVHLERPFGIPDGASTYECIPSREGVRHYGALITHADVLVNIGSTTSLDAIAADTPVVNISFDIEDIVYEFSAARFYDYSHYKPILESRAVRLVHDPESFFCAMNAYLSDRTLDRDLRAKACREFLTYSDGRSADRIAAAITTLC